MRVVSVNEKFLYKLAFLAALLCCISIILPNSVAAKAASPKEQAEKFCKDNYSDKSEKRTCADYFVQGYSNGTQYTPCPNVSNPREEEICHDAYGAGTTAAKKDGAGGCKNKKCEGGDWGDDAGSAGNDTPCNQNSCDLIKKYVNPTINLLSVIFGIVAAGSLIMGGIQFSTSEGDPQKAAHAKDRISGTIVAIFAYAFIYAFLQFLVPGGLFNR